MHPHANAPFVGVLIASLVLLCTAAAAPGSAAKRASQISSTVILFNMNEIDTASTGDGDFTSQCISTLYKAAESGSNTVNFVNTQYWSYNISDKNHVQFYCYKEHYERDTCIEFDAAAIVRFKRGMRNCFRKAVEMGMDISLTPHLDDAFGLGAWRNALIMDPTAKHAGNNTEQGGFSYYDIMLKPLAQALNAVISNSTKVYFAMQGEMSATVFRFPTQYTELINILKHDITANRSDILWENIKVGVSTNFNKLCACVLDDLPETQSVTDPGVYLQLFPAAFAPKAHEFDMPAIQHLYQSVDLIGVSSYAALPVNFTIDQLQTALWQLDEEISHFGINLKSLVNEAGKLLILSEYGTGGGAANNGTVPAATAEEVASLPFFGIFQSYNRSSDPWRMYEPEAVPVATRSFRRHFYVQTSRWLLNGGSPSYPISHVFLWNMASWDVQGVHPGSSSWQGSYRDEVVVRRIQVHNKLARGLAVDEADALMMVAAPAAFDANGTANGTDAAAVPERSSAGPEVVHTLQELLDPAVAGR